MRLFFYLFFLFNKRKQKVGDFWRLKVHLRQINIQIDYSIWNEKKPYIVFEAKTMLSFNMVIYAGKLPNGPFKPTE